MPNQSAAANRSPGLQSDGSDNFSAIVAADRALSVRNAATILFPRDLTLGSAHHGPAAVAELGRYVASHAPL
jgi:hypothetical protein